VGEFREGTPETSCRIPRNQCEILAIPCETAIRAVVALDDIGRVGLFICTDMYSRRLGAKHQIDHEN